MKQQEREMILYRLPRKMLNFKLNDRWLPLILVSNGDLKDYLIARCGAKVIRKDSPTEKAVTT